jgi:hypothetical protein
MTKRIVALAMVLVAAGNAHAQSPASDLDSLVMTTVRDAVAPALPYPSSDDAGSLPADSTSTVAWMVRPLQPGERTIEVLANPLNASNQARAAKAMMQIEAAIEAAQKRAQAAYDRAVAEVQRTGKSQDVDGITLGDEGVAGARIDADAHLIIDVAYNQPAYAYTIRSSIEPTTQTTAASTAVATIAVPANVYREGRDAAVNERFCAPQTLVFFGGVTAPAVRKQSSVSFETTAASVANAAQTSRIRSLVLSLSGNAQLIDQVLKQADWSRLQKLFANP